MRFYLLLTLSRVVSRDSERPICYCTRPKMTSLETFNVDRIYFVSPSFAIQLVLPALYYLVHTIDRKYGTEFKMYKQCRYK